MYSVVTVFWKITQWGDKTDTSICKVPYFARLGAISRMHYVCLFGVSPTKYLGVFGISTEQPYTELLCGIHDIGYYFIVGHHKRSNRVVSHSELPFLFLWKLELCCCNQSSDSFI